MLKSLALLMCCLVYIAINGTSAVNQANLAPPTESPSPVSLNTTTLPMGAWSTGYYLDEVGDQTSRLRFLDYNWNILEPGIVRFCAHSKDVC